MFNWITSNFGTIAVGAIVAAALIAAVLRMIKNKRDDKSSCGCRCSGCTMAGRCREKSRSH